MYIGRHTTEVKSNGQQLGGINRISTNVDDNSGHNLVLSSRTDAGVNVRRNGGVVTLARSLWDSLTERKMVRAVDDRLPDSIAFLGVKEVNDDWNPRIASNRVYRYRLEGMQGWQYPGENSTIG